MEGYLKKKSPKGFMAKPWQTRYFKLYVDSLHYFKKGATAGVIPLASVKFVHELPNKAAGRFDVVIGMEGR